MKKALALYCAILLGGCVLMAPALTFGQSLASKLDQLKAYPDLILVNAKIITINDRLPQAQAMAVRNGRILAIGSNEQIRFLAGPQTQVLDAKGRTVLPGLIDSHQHAHLQAVQHFLGAEGDFAAKRYHDPELQIFYARGKNRDEVVKELERIVHERAKALGPGKWIWVGLFAGNTLPESKEIVSPLFPPSANAVLTRKYLDQLAPDNPLEVMIPEISSAAHNTKAAEQMVKYLGRETDTRNVLLYDLLLRGQTEEKADLIEQYLSKCLATQGVTTFGSQYWNTPSVMKDYNYLYQHGTLSVRWGWFFDTPSDDSGARTGKNADSFFRNLGDFRGIGNDYIWNAGISNEGWESGLSCTTAEPLNSKSPATTSLVNHAVDRSCSPPINYENVEGYRNVRSALDNGLRIAFLHTYSDGTWDALFHLINSEVADGNITLDQARQTRISGEHNPLIRPDQVQTIAKLGIIPSFTEHKLQGNSPGALFLQEFGDRYMNWVSPIKSLVDAGVHPVLATDMPLCKGPIYTREVDYPDQWDGNIWAILEFFVTRKMPNNGIVYNHNEAVDRVTMLKMATIWAAEMLLNEKNIGSLEEGKLADFIVIDKDFMTVPDDQIHTIKTLLTVMGGKTTYKAANY